MLVLVSQEAWSSLPLPMILHHKNVKLQEVAHLQFASQPGGIHLFEFVSNEVVSSAAFLVCWLS